MPTITTPVMAPVKGVVRSVPREGQPADTLWDAQNMVPYDRYGRKRLAQRGGLVQQITSIGGTAANALNANFVMIQGMVEAPVLSYAQPEVAVGTLTQLSGSPTFTSGFTATSAGGAVAPVDYGPPAHYTHTYPSESTGLIYDWQFQLATSIALPSGGQCQQTGTGNALESMNGNTVSGLFVAQFPYTASTTNTVFLAIGIGFDYFLGGSGQLTVTAAVYQGDSSQPSSTWGSPLTPRFGTTYPSFTVNTSSGATLTQTLACEFQIDAVPTTTPGQVTFTMNGHSVVVQPSASYGTVWPNLGMNLVQVPGMSANTTAATFTMALTDTGTAISAIPSTPAFSTPASLLVAACHGQVYYGDAAGNFHQAGGLSNPLKTRTLVNMAFLSGTTPSGGSGLGPCVFLVDGTNFEYFDVGAKTVSVMTADAGTLPTNCSLIVNWRGRLVLAGDSSNPNNVYMSRVGDPRDYNYAALDPAAAVALQLSTAGQLGEPIMALIPFSDDYMMIGCLNSLWMLQGDPADGGTIVNVSKSMGMTANNAWCIGPDGTLYFIARGGLYSVKPAWEFYRPPELMSNQTYDQYFKTIINGQFYLSMQFDVDNHYIHIFATSVNTEQTGTHMIFDVRNGGLWPQVYPHNQSPVCSCQYMANATNGKPAILLGGFDSSIRYWSTGYPYATNPVSGNSNLSDDGTAINAYAVIGPIKADPQASILSAVTIDMGEVLYANTATVAQDPGDHADTGANWDAVATLFSGPDAFSVTEGAELAGVLSPNYNTPPVTTPHSFNAVSMPLDRRQTTFRQRLRGGWHSLMLNNSAINTYFSFESAVFEFQTAGKNRERR
jgi:hypothetical protein